ncbi:MAG: hypothetical protein JNL10_09570 [Verrucomicrobiales bacterium]|nr:hypothetical protein [Verrucomicrobiales bacterium]
MTLEIVSVSLTDMKVNSRQFQRDFARMKAKASAGITVHVESDGEIFTFQSARPKTWQGSLKGKARIAGDLFSTGLNWESSQ